VTSPPAISDPAPPPTNSPEDLLCPNCGYDLRAATTDRCSECGLVIDRGALRESGFPWAHRKRIGRRRAFIRTLWLVTFDSRKLRGELARAQEPRDAAWFRAMNTALLAVTLIGIAAVAGAQSGMGSIAIEPYSLSYSNLQPLPGWQQDLAVPWCAGITILPAIALYPTLLAIYLTGVGRATMRLGHYPESHRQWARALELYAAAPLAWALIGAAAYAMSYAAREVAGDEWRMRGAVAYRQLELVLKLFAALVVAAALLLSLWRSGEWFARAHHAGVARFIAGVAEMTGRMLVGVVVCLGLIPWCLGLIWMIVDSLR
jgi:hypothetical protein